MRRGICGSGVVERKGESAHKGAEMRSENKGMIAEGE